ncbi:MAG TPA: ATP-binding protein [Candidatus Baltobacteraceae bacterium]|jgi:anti-sigma regulatory factor (Ser/Thr protein kinase)|nr:ATP-binding protein [Candidatus Baltobacteraceae bacterium]
MASELRIKHVATVECAKLLRHALSSFLNVLDMDPTSRDDIVTAAGEALVNALEHAYTGQELGTVELYAQENGSEGVSIIVSDNGSFIVRDHTPGRGFGLPIVHAIAKTVSIETDKGTRVKMMFDAPNRTPSVQIVNEGDTSGNV